MANVSCGWLEFDGADDTVSFPDNALYDVTDSISMSLWLVRDWEDGESALVTRAGTISVTLNARDEIVVTVSGVAAVTAKLALQKQEVHQIGIVVKEVGSDLLYIFYHRGREVYRTAVASAALPAATNTAFYLGSTAGASAFFNGRMSNFLLVTDELTAAEMLVIWNKNWVYQDAALYDAKILCIPFDDGSGTSLDDDSGNGIDGTAAGTPDWRVPANPGLVLGNGFLMASLQGDHYYGKLILDTWEWIRPNAAGDIVELADWYYNRFGIISCATKYDGGGQHQVAGAPCCGLRVVDLDSGYVVFRARAEMMG